MKYIKRNKNRIILFVLFVVFALTYALTSFNLIVFYVRHISIFLFLTMIAYLINKKYFDRLLSKTNKNKGIIGLGIRRVISMVLIIGVISALQINYINQKDTYVLNGCTYYDQYNNEIFKSNYDNTCPELKNYTTNLNKLSFTVEEKMEGIYSSYFLANSSYGTGSPVKGDIGLELLTDVEITYDGIQRIIAVELTFTERIEIRDEDRVQMNTTNIRYENLYMDGEFSQLKRIVTTGDANVTKDTVLHHQQLSEFEPIYSEIYSVIDNSYEDEKTINIFLEEGVPTYDKELIYSSTIFPKESFNEIKIYNVQRPLSSYRLLHIEPEKLTISNIYQDENDKITGSTNNVYTSLESFKFLKSSYFNTGSLNFLNSSYKYNRSVDMITGNTIVYRSQNRYLGVDEVTSTEYGYIINHYSRNYAPFWDGYKFIEEPDSKGVALAIDHNNYEIFDWTNYGSSRLTYSLVHKEIPFFYEFYQFE